MHENPAPTMLREGCRGLPPLDARLEPWMQELLADPAACADLLARHGSPVNLHDFAALSRNAAELEEAAAATGTPLRIFAARKANKTLGLMEAARARGLGLDLGSHRELSQALDLGIAPEDIIVTAAVKPEPLLRLALDSGVTLALDNLDEAAAVDRLAADPGAARAGAAHPVALRLAPSPDELIAPTRFGESAATWTHWAQARAQQDRAGQDRAGAADPLRIDGVHLHLHGYDAAARVRAIGEAIQLLDALRALGHRPAFLDIGGGIPMSYLDDAAQWAAFLAAREDGAASDGGPLTWRDEPLRQFYPYHQSTVRGPWLRAVLAGEIAPGVSVAAALADRALELRCEPGRSLLDGCGMTLASVVQRTTTSDGVGLVGLEMNRTQCRSTSDDFLVDPILVRGSAEPSPPMTGFLVGAYCIEAELILRRRLTFPRGVGIGDVIALPNTAGYLMHILESASHQLPLASNLVSGDGGFVRDRIDAQPAVRPW
ncbi:diaminopimelate decarboxylase [Brachybacterium phenoliresistens]|uniref:Diaminopimelate decarboxylase n=1 Tax=Brachybacterium phenoliresistens TaxID=396014 RepID=Z9JVD3_9MICO|nr:diaminopimelate decarboxylase [Brachybacterium phenoliresistens]EWS81761.1 diaminopimelate decarboxylase [Brachybacterium phenoliresistens]